MPEHYRHLARTLAKQDIHLPLERGQRKDPTIPARRLRQQLERGLPGWLRRLLGQGGAVEVPGASPVTREKAGEILHHGTVHGKALTAKQRGLFRLIAGGGRPSRAKGYRG